MKRQLIITGILCIVLMAAMGTQASTIASYDDLDGISVTYMNINEITDDGAYGVPTISGDTMDFNPNIIASSPFSTVGAVTNTAQLSFDVAAHAGMSIQGLLLSENGVLSVEGFGATDATFVDVTANFSVTIDEVNGVDVADFSDTFSMTFNPNEDGTWAFSDGTVNAKPWDGQIFLPFITMLDNNGYDPDTQGATLASVSLENVLIASSEATSGTEIKKIDTDVFSVTAQVIPEPASAALIVGAASLLAFVRRRFIG